MARQTPQLLPGNVRTWSGILDSGYITSLDQGNTSNTVDNDDDNNDENNEPKPRHPMLKPLLETVGPRQLENKHNRSANLTLP